MPLEASGRVVYLPPEALEALKAWDGKTMALERERGIIVRHVFDNDGRAIRHYYHEWRSAFDRLVSRAGCSATSAAPPRATTTRAGVPGRVASATRPAQFLPATTSRASRISATRLCAWLPRALGQTAEVVPLKR